MPYGFEYCLIEMPTDEVLFGSRVHSSLHTQVEHAVVV